MTLVVAAALVSGGVLILSAVNNWSLRETVLRVFSGDLDPAKPAPGNSKVLDSLNGVPITKGGTDARTGRPRE